MTTENLSNPYNLDYDNIELKVAEMKGDRAVYQPIELTVKAYGKFNCRGKDYKQVSFEDVGGFWEIPHALAPGAKGIGVLTRNKNGSTLYNDCQSWEPVDGGQVVAPTEKVSVPVASSGGSVDGRNRSIERQVAVKALIELAPHCEGLVSAGFMKSETAARVVRKAVLGAEELLGELSEDNG